MSTERRYISTDDVLLAVAGIRSLLDVPSRQSIDTARELLDSLEWRLVTDAIESGVDLQPFVLTEIPRC